VVVFDSRKGDDEKRHGQGPKRSYVSYPVRSKHISFEGDLYHGATAELSTARLLGVKETEPCMVLLVNIWGTGEPAATTRLGQAVVDKMSNFNYCFGLRAEAGNTMQTPHWTGTRGGRGEISRLEEHVEGLTAALPAGVFRQALGDALDEAGNMTKPAMHNFWVRTK
jgi:hypothetical protein